MAKMNIGLADDHLPTLKRVSSYLKEKGFEMHSKKKFPDILLLDINMPFIDGVSATFYLKLYFPAVKVIGLSIYNDSSIISTLIASGACGYMLKADLESMLDIAIDCILSGNIYIDERVELNDREHFLQEEKNTYFPGENIFGLTPREIAFVALNATSLSYDQIAKIMFVETKTIQTYFDRVSKKLHISSRQSLTIFSIQNGLAKVANYPRRALVDSQV
jgi:DNA-binding NarL/FixJ family response regulator